MLRSDNAPYNYDLVVREYQQPHGNYRVRPPCLIAYALAHRSRPHFRSVVLARSSVPPPVWNTLLVRHSSGLRHRSAFSSVATVHRIRIVRLANRLHHNWSPDLEWEANKEAKNIPHIPGSQRGPALGQAMHPTRLHHQFGLWETHRNKRQPLLHQVPTRSQRHPSRYSRSRSHKARLFQIS